METTWSLDVLYQGYDDPKFKQDLEKMKELVHEINALPNELRHEDELKSIEHMLTTQEAYQQCVSTLANYISLRQATNTTDRDTIAYMGQLEQLASTCTKAFSACERFLVECDDLPALISQSAYLKDYEYYLTCTKKDGQHLLSDDVEEVIAKMNLSGGNAWGNLQEFLTSTLQVTYEGKQITLSEVRNLAYDPDPSVRKAAYEAELHAYDQVKESVAFALNNIKSQVNTICELRGFPSPLDMTLYYSRMEKTTLDAMLDTIKEYLPIFHQYYKQKAKLLGYQGGLPWYELFAPLKGNDKKYSIEDAKKALLDHFYPFAQDMGEMIEQAFHDRWIDFYPRQGKVGGAFCANLSSVKQSRVLTNFDGSLGDIVTLAHELGHAFHGMMIEEHRPLNTDYSMPVAETASTFNENIMMNALIEEEQDPNTKLALMESQLQDLAQIICDIYSRFRFEQMVFEKRKNSFMFADELCEMMKTAQKEAYGDAIEESTLHPYMWLNKSHYYSSSLSYYNFPYAFGGLFARGLIAQYQKEGASFVPKYRRMLEATTITSVEGVAHMAGIDISSPDFWKSSLDACVENINSFIKLSEEKLRHEKN